MRNHSTFPAYWRQTVDQTVERRCGNWLKNLNLPSEYRRVVRPDSSYNPHKACGSTTCNHTHRTPNCRRELRGSWISDHRHQGLPDQSPAPLPSNLSFQTSPAHIPTRCHTCRKAPSRWADSIRLLYAENTRPSRYRSCSHNNNIFLKVRTRSTSNPIR